MRYTITQNLLHARTLRRTHHLSALQRHRVDLAARALTAWDNAYFRWNVTFDEGGTYWTRPFARSNAYREDVISEMEQRLSHKGTLSMSELHRKRFRILGIDPVGNTNTSSTDDCISP